MLDEKALMMALLALARHNIPTDTQELLVAGNPDRSIPPGALASALTAASAGQVVGVGDAVGTLRRYWNGRCFAMTTDQDAEKIDAALAALQAAAPVAWESTTVCYKPFITDAQYRKFSPEAQRWYKPYRCSNCSPVASPPVTDEMVEAARAIFLTWAEHNGLDATWEETLSGHAQGADYPKLRDTVILARNEARAALSAALKGGE